jgi:predicted DNA-binding transcriptional regulator AlpA
LGCEPHESVAVDEWSRNSRIEFQYLFGEVCRSSPDRSKATFMQNTAGTTDTRRKLLTVRETMKLTTLGRTSLWELPKDGLFPRAVKLCKGRLAYFEEEVLQWLANRPRTLEDNSGSLTKTATSIDYVENNASRLFQAQQSSQ